MRGTGEGHQTQLEAGMRTFNGPRQLYVPQPIPICSNAGGGEGSFSTIVRVPVPSSQTRVKLSVIYFPTSGDPGDLSGFGNIWVAAAEEDIKGMSGSSGRIVPVTDVEGTSAAPTSFPATNGLSGYSREFVTSADWLQAVITLNSIGGGRVGNWVLQTSIQPEAIRFDWESWEQIRRLFVPQLVGPAGNL